MVSNTTKTSCKNGHEFTQENTYRPPGSNERQCRQCRKETARRNYDKDKRKLEYLKNKKRNNENSKAWYRNNKKRHKELMHEWLTNNKERHLDLQRNWYTKNKERHLENTKNWSANNLQLKALYAANRRAKKKQASGHTSPQQLKWILDYYGKVCYYCDGAFEEIDHVIPLDNGGTNWPSNLRPACRSCNRRKGTMSVHEFIALLEKDFKWHL